MSLALSVSKGRSGSDALQCIRRHIAAYPLVTSCRFIPRWTRSEHSIADGPSRCELADSTSWRCPGDHDSAQLAPVPAYEADSQSATIFQDAISHFSEPGDFVDTRPISLDSDDQEASFSICDQKAKGSSCVRPVVPRGAKPQFVLSRTSLDSSCYMSFLPNLIDPLRSVVPVVMPGLVLEQRARPCVSDLPRSALLA